MQNTFFHVVAKCYYWLKFNFSSQGHSDPAGVIMYLQEIKTESSDIGTKITFWMEAYVFSIILCDFYSVSLVHLWALFFKPYNTVFNWLLVLKIKTSNTNMYWDRLYLGRLTKTCISVNKHLLVKLWHSISWLQDRGSIWYFILNPLPFLSPWNIEIILWILVRIAWLRLVQQIPITYNSGKKWKLTPELRL